MAVPTADELYDYLTSLMERTNEPHAVFEWQYLNASAFRHYKSKSTPIDRVMKQLVEDGRLVGVRISEGGYVYLDHNELRVSLFTLYFQYSGSRRYYDREDWGVITHERAKDHDNVWRSGVRRLYTTRPRYEAMLADFLKAKEQHDKAKQQEEDEEQRQVQDGLNAIAPDATQLLKRLDDLIPGLDRRMRARSYAERDVVVLGFDLRNAEQIGPFLDVLRRGLPDVPRETSEPQ